MEHQLHFETQLIVILPHILVGEIKRGKSFGIHFFQEEIHQIEEITKATNKVGVWEARISVRHPKTNNWVSKVKSSTFFPRSWDEAILKKKLIEALKTQKRIERFQSIGITNCGISISFFYKENTIVGCYPLYY